MKSNLRFLGAMLAVLLAGCSGSDFPLAEVSGVVTLDGKALPEARVIFMPHAAADSVMAGPASITFTDESGHFRMETKDGDDGAVVGRHKVSITTHRVKIDPDDPMKVTVLSKERLPAIYHNESQLSFVVPDSGTQEANFTLRSKP